MTSDSKTPTSEPSTEPEGYADIKAAVLAFQKQKLDTEALDMIVGHAKPNCKWCHGTGTITRYIEAHKNAHGGQALCGCAMRRFLKADPK